MSKLEVKSLDIEKVPVIDITKLCDGTDPISVSKELHKASTGLGFIYIKGHGIPENVIKSLRDEGLQFLEVMKRKKLKLKYLKNIEVGLAMAGLKCKIKPNQI